MSGDLTMKVGIVGELLRFFWQRKFWWVTPMILLMLLFGLLALFAGSSPVSPLIYTLF